MVLQEERPRWALNILCSLAFDMNDSESHLIHEQCVCIFPWQRKILCVNQLMSSLMWTAPLRQLTSLYGDCFHDQKFAGDCGFILCNTSPTSHFRFNSIQSRGTLSLNKSHRGAENKHLACRIIPSALLTCRSVHETWLIINSLSI